MLRNPDFQAYAPLVRRAGVAGRDADGLRGALREALAANAPALIEVVSDIDKDYPPYEFHQPRLP